MKASALAILALLILGCAYTTVVEAFGCAREQPAATRATTGQNVEELGYTGRTTKECLATDTPQDFQEMYRSAAAKDQEGMTEQIMNGSAFDVPAGTLIRVIDYNDGAIGVRFLNGEFQERTGWISDEYLR